jgi:hypothetical protein
MSYQKSLKLLALPTLLTYLRKGRLQEAPSHIATPLGREKRLHITKQNPVLFAAFLKSCHAFFGIHDQEEDWCCPATSPGLREH